MKLLGDPLKAGLEVVHTTFSTRRVIVKAARASGNSKVRAIDDPEVPRPRSWAAAARTRPLGRYAELRYNEPLASTYRRHGERLGRRFLDPAIIPLSVAGSTDMGNVSHAVPALHAMIEIADLDVPGHSEAFREAAASPRGDQAVLDGAKALALTAADLWQDRELLDRARVACTHGPHRP